MTYPAPFLAAVGPYPDLLGDLRSWLRTHTWLQPLVAGRVFFRIPKGPTFPLIRIYDAGTTRLPGEIPLISGQVGIDIWGGTYQQVKDITNAVAAALDYLPTGSVIGAATVLLNVDVGTAVDSPDPDTGDPRKVLTPTVTARALTLNG